MEKDWKDSSVRLILTGDLRTVMDRRGVCEEDIRQVISFAEGTSNKLMNIDTGHFIAHLIIGNITCWVEYVPEGNAYRVFNTYLHRLVIEEGR
jgi:hypothetical protein